MSTAAVVTHRLFHGDCIEQMRELDEASVDAICTDPPYGIRFMGKAWDGADIEAATRHNAEVKPPRTDGRTVARDSASMYAGSYDLSPTGNQAFQRWCHEWATEALRILKPGGHLLAFGGTRTYHRLACAVEDAGFEIRDQVLTINGKGVAEPSGMLAWIYGSG